MIAKFKKRSYKLSAVAILLVVALGAVLLTNASENGKSSEPDVQAQAGNTKIEIPSIYHGHEWTNSLYRALDFRKFDFKVSS